MKPVIRYLIVCVVMAIFVGIVVYFLLQSPPKKVSGPCGSGKCNDKATTDDSVTEQTPQTLNIANVLNEHSISTNPIEATDEESDEEDIPDLVNAFMPPPIEAIAGLSQFMKNMNADEKINKNQTTIEEIDSSSEEEESQIVSCGQIHELANEIVKQNETTPDEREVVPVVTTAPPPTTPKRRGRPSKASARKEKEISEILNPPEKPLEIIKE